MRDLHAHARHWMRVLLFAVATVFILLAVLMFAVGCAHRRPSPLRCIDACLPNGVNLDRACYERCCRRCP